MKQLQRDVAVELGVPGAKDVAGGALADELEENEAPPSAALRSGGAAAGASSSDAGMLRCRAAMLSTRRRCRTIRRSLAGALASTVCQSTGLPSATDAARSASARSSAFKGQSSAAGSMVEMQAVYRHATVKVQSSRGSRFPRVGYCGAVSGSGPLRGGPMRTLVAGALRRRHTALILTPRRCPDRARSGNRPDP